MAAAASRPEVDAGVEAQVGRGPVRVLVELRIPGGIRPEGELSPEARATQRQAIATAQSAVLSRLGGTDVTLVRRFESVPLLALQIGPSALSTLRTMGDLVTRVIADAATPPARGGSPRPQ